MARSGPVKALLALALAIFTVACINSVAVDNAAWSIYPAMASATLWGSVCACVALKVRLDSRKVLAE